MNILWITNTIFPAPSRELGLPIPVVGGWMYGLARQLCASSSSICLAVATVYPGTTLRILDIDGVRYYLLPQKNATRYPVHLEKVWRQVADDFMPDLVHIHGTEFMHGLACMRACSDLAFVVSIQGLVSVYARYYYAGMTKPEIIQNITFRDIVRLNTIFHGKKTFDIRGEFEKEYIKRTKHVIGRTSWDYAHAKAINPDVMYHFCNETLRDGFYTAGKWDVKHKVDYSIFLSQAAYPIKGLHQVLKAMAILKDEFPQIQLRVAGHDITDTSSLKSMVKLTGYGLYIKRLIRQLYLEERVVFTGPLSEEQMIAEYQNAHLFICPSSIENSPNSVGEAQIIGTPVIASYVGGVADMVVHGETGLLYRFEEVEMLVENIRLLFINDAYSEKLSRHGTLAAAKRHDQLVNGENNQSIYQRITSCYV